MIYRVIVVVIFAFSDCRSRQRIARGPEARPCTSSYLNRSLIQTTPYTHAGFLQHLTDFSRHSDATADMAILSFSNLPSWLKMLCLLSLPQQSKCSPISVIGYNPLVDAMDTSRSTSAPSSVNKSATSLLSFTSLGAPVPNCATLPKYAEWFQPSEKFDTGDCPKAIELFFTDYTKDHDGTKYEFLASGVPPVHGIPTQRVPLKVAYGASR